MEGDVETAIAALKRHFTVATDQGLADRLRLGRSTVTSWRRRGAVPGRYVRLASVTRTSLPDFLDPKFDPVEREALILAMVRVISGFGSRITDYRAFLQHGPFLLAQLALGIEKALLDLTVRMTESELDDARQALNLIVYEDFFSAK
jgi:Bacteriophage CI repressor helix-turn-helix domain